MTTNLEAIYKKLESCAFEIDAMLQKKVKDFKAKFIYTGFAVDRGVVYLDYTISKGESQFLASMNIILNSNNIDTVVDMFAKQWNI